MSGTRVLLENPDGAVLWACERLLVRAGFEVTTCSGRRDGVPCDLVADEHCELAQEADVIVNGLPPRDLDVLAAQQRLLPDVPLVLQARADDDRFEGVELPEVIVSPLASGPKFIEAVRRAAGNASD